MEHDQKVDDGAYRFNDLKPRVDLMDPISILEVGAVFSYGIAKYGSVKPDWRTGQPWSHMYGSLMRHVMAWWYGEDIDEDSGLPHVWMMGCNAHMIQSTVRLHPEMDDRFKHATPEEVRRHIEATMIKEKIRE